MSERDLRLELSPYSPAEMARRVEASGVEKAALGVSRLLALSILAGAFIGLGASFATVVGTNTGLGFGPTRLLVGLAFSLGLILVVVAGAELFTGNNLLVMAWLHKRVSAGQVLRNWGIVYVGNFAGALLTAWGCHLSGLADLSHHQVGQSAVQIAVAKVSLSWNEAFFRGVFCNALVCLAVWLCYGARTTSDKILSVIFPITAFVAIGFEHSVANMYYIPTGLWLRNDPNAVAASIPPADFAQLTWSSFLWNNLLPVTLGNLVGGAVMVGVVYWFVYLRERTDRPLATDLRISAGTPSAHTHGPDSTS